MNEQELLEKRKKWYFFKPAIYEMIKTCHNKEISFIDTINRTKSTRYLFASTTDYLLKHFKAFNFLTSNINFYQSCAYLKNIPIMTYNLKIRKDTPEYQEFDNNYGSMLTGFDLFFDFDGKKDFSKCYKESTEFKEILEEHKVPYYLLNSSAKGFHFIIPYSFIDNNNPTQTISDCKEITLNLKKIYVFDCLDKSISDLKRLKKVPYSFVADGTIALPLTDKQFLNFTPEMVNIDSVMKNVRIIKRGLLIRDYGMTTEQLKKNTSKFINDFLE